MRFAFCQQSSVDWVATTRPNCCFHLVEVLIGWNVANVGRIRACLAYFGHISAKIAAFFLSSKLLCLENRLGSRSFWWSLRGLRFDGPQTKIWKRNKTTISVEMNQNKKKILLRINTNLSDFHFCLRQLLLLSKDWVRPQRQRNTLKIASFCWAPVCVECASVETAWVSRVWGFLFWNFTR